MRIFVYKSLFVFLCLFLLFQLTIGAKIRQLNYELEKFKSQENIENIKDKIRDELSKRGYVVEDTEKGTRIKRNQE